MNTNIGALSQSVSVRKIPTTVSYYLSFIALGLIEATLGPTLPALAEHTGADLKEISFLFTARSLGYLFGSFAGGRLFDRLPGHWVMAGFIILAAVMMALVPLMPLLWLLTVVLFITGVAQAGVDVGGNTMLVWVHQGNVGPFMNGLHFFFGVGAFLSPIIIAQLVLLSGDIYWAYWAIVALVLPVSLWLFLLPSPSVQETSADDTRQFDLRLLILFAFFFMMFVGAETSFGGWIFTYVSRMNLATETAAAYLTSAFWGGLTVGRLLSIPIATRLRPRVILTADLLGSVFSLCLILLWPGVLPVIWVGTVGFGFFMASIFPTTVSFAERRMIITGKVTSGFMVGASIGSMTVPWIIGQFIESVGPGVIMGVIFGTLLLSLGVFAVLMRYSTPRVAAS